MLNVYPPHHMHSAFGRMEEELMPSRLTLIQEFQDWREKKYGTPQDKWPNQMAIYSAEWAEHALRTFCPEYQDDE